MDNIIQALWVKGSLNKIQELCICSFLRNGHEFHLYTYNKKIKVPEGTIVKDASEIIPQKDVFIDNRGSLASFADWFRYNLLFEKGGWWVDMDMVCMKPFDFTSDYVFSSEHGENGSIITNIGAIKVPVQSTIMEYCKKEAHKILLRDLPNVKWGTLGLVILNNYLRTHKKYQSAVQQPHIFCPIPPQLFHILFFDIMVTFTEKTYGVHLWNEMLRSQQWDSIKEFHPHSFMERSFAKYVTR